MSINNFRNYLSAELVAMVLIFFAGAILLLDAKDLPKESALLPIAMLVFMMLLALVLFFTTLRKLHKKEEQKPLIAKPARFLGVIVTTIFYAIAVDNLGFYTSTAIMVPLTSWAFGYRRWAHLLISAVVFVGILFLIFHVAMNRQFPTEFFLR
ncbi:tripartite tricarboxylate transporter TctB family protein [Cocleimonas sp. KMM 6892]|uniref:tripartite tricarboxylate transporter TctB family protein n=1 Tax=unclassified Cocleimonas TaxID=2639732 RepID=UPI002DB9253A|nr:MULTISPECIES: tripartite tricarboxylate transporter TctB family protein [unclassified Cocleimonas]MEB8431046.1 tripartite tricarboxylate transporter TctB family protein [Cocleimonas sp. KMM 6892]MEC4714182.1 tripartite tricarboxylate transporter TctB family protein [Cocleimonas sp. KMM 6895]MEC4743513.1 tripartite tricarboxylate transporter TctB family protein [Cocleimonas sp. KMM 6896]